MKDTSCPIRRLAERLQKVIRRRASRLDDRDDFPVDASGAQRRRAPKSRPSDKHDREMDDLMRQIKQKEAEHVGDERCEAVRVVLRTRGPLFFL